MRIDAKSNLGGGLKYKAFTLIELLVVIIIVGVIVSPMILKIMKKATFERSIDKIIETVRISYSGDSFLVCYNEFNNKEVSI